MSQIAAISSLNQVQKIVLKPFIWNYKTGGENTSYVTAQFSTNFTWWVKVYGLYKIPKGDDVEESSSHNVIGYTLAN